MSFSRHWTRYEMLRLAGCTAICRKPQVQGQLASGEEFGPLCEYAPTAARFKPCRTQTHLTSKSGTDRLSFGIPRWTGNEPISRNPSGVPILNSCAAHGAFKAADIALRYYVLAAVINRAAFTGSMMTQGGF